MTSDHEDGFDYLLNAERFYNDQEKAYARVEPAWAKAALYWRTNGTHHFGHEGRRMRGLLAIHQELEARRKRYEAGDNQELLHAINLCADENLPLPTWLATAYTRKLTAFLQPNGPTTLDDAFGSNRMPVSPIRAEQARRDWQIAGRLWRAVWEVAPNHTALDPALRAVLMADKSFGVALTRAREMVDMIDKNQAELLPGYEGLSRFWEKRRKGVK